MGIVYLAYTSGNAVSSGSTIPMNMIVRRKCTNIGTDMTITGAGYYKVFIDTNLTIGGTAGNVTVTLYQNGVAVTGATATQSVAANGTAALSFSAIIRNNCCSTTTLTIVYNGVALANTYASAIIENV